MKPLLRLFSNPSGPAADGWQQPEREALIDLLLLTMFIDQRLTLAEGGLVDREVAALQWEGRGKVEDYVEAATRSIRERRSTDDGRSNILASVRERLNSPEARQRAMAVCQALVAVDGVDTAETSFLDDCRKVLGAE